MEDYCSCALPIRITYSASERYKVPRCGTCFKKVNPESKSVNKFISKLNLVNPTRNEVVIEKKINELLELMQANGEFVGHE